MVTGVLYWAAWRVLLPKVFGYELIPRKEILDDGTVITLVGILYSSSSTSHRVSFALIAVLESESPEDRITFRVFYWANALCFGYRGLLSHWMLSFCSCIHTQASFYAIPTSST